MSTTVNFYNCACGASVQVGSSCQKCSGQSAEASQTLPAKSVPCNNTGECEESQITDCVYWSGPDNAYLGIKNGDPMTKVVNSIITKMINGGIV